MDALWLMLGRGAYLVGLEPSCILTFRDELPALFPETIARKGLRERALLLDEFLAREVPGFMPLATKPLTRQGDAARPLSSEGYRRTRYRNGDSVEDRRTRARSPRRRMLRDGRAFGYEDSHFAVSKACADRVLVPAINDSDRETIVISDGFSCRTQIRQFCPGPPSDASGAGSESRCAKMKRAAS